MASTREMQDQIAAQASRIAELESEVSRLKNPPPREAPDVPLSARDLPFQMPSSRQLLRLWEIAQRGLPGPAAQASFEGFAAAFHFLGAASEIQHYGEVNGKVYPTYWTGMASEFVRQLGRSASINLYGFLCAVAVTGDIVYVLPDSLHGQIAVFGLVVGCKPALRGEGGVIIRKASWPATNQWLGVLADCAIRKPLAPPPLPPQPARVVQSNLVRHYDDRPMITEL